MQYLSISDLERGGRTDPIFVLNTASESVIASNGEILLTIPKINGTGSDALTISQTWLPQEITLQIPRLQILKSTEFRGAIGRKLIAVISEKDARRLLGSDGATEEQSRLDALRRHIREAGAARSITESPTEIHRADGQKDGADDSRIVTMSSGDEDAPNEGTSVAVLAAQGVEDVESGITSQFSMLVDKWNTMPDISVTNEIRSRRKFSVKELRYLQRTLNKGLTKSLAMVARNLSPKN